MWANMTSTAHLVESIPTAINPSVSLKRNLIYDGSVSAIDITIGI